MNRTEILKQMKMQFKKLMSFDNATTQLTTTDGKNLIVMGEDAEVGLQVNLLNPDNTQSPVDDGDYVLQDGRTITVAAGTITNVTAPTAAATKNDSPADASMADASVAPTDAADTSADTEDDTTDTEILDRISALEDAVNQILEMLQGAMSKTEKTLSTQKELAERFEKFADQPVKNKLELKPKINSDKKLSVMDEIREIANKKYNR